MYFTYTFILTAGLLVTFPFYVVRFRKYLPTLSDRLGFLRLPQLHGVIWVHAVSVGEVKAIERLVERLRQQFPQRRIVVSTATPTGQELARRRSDIIDHTFYFPIDLPFCIRSTVDRIDPSMIIIAETEIWPNFLRICRGRNIPVVMINGRISDKSFARYRLVRRWLRRVFEDYTMMGMQSEMDRKRIEAIGADPQKVTVFGNLKYDVVAGGQAIDALLTDLLSKWNEIWIAASTMPEEEELVLDAFAELQKTNRKLKLIIAPRHADRFDAVAEIVKKRGMPYIRRSLLNSHPGGGDFAVLLLDTIGELSALFQYAAVVFMGATLVPKGGHNILEPARHCKPIVFGPHMENFRDIARLFLETKAAVQIQTPGELAPAIRSILSDTQLASRLGRNALTIIEQNTGATDRVLRFLQPIEARQ